MVQATPKIEHTQLTCSQHMQMPNYAWLFPGQTPTLVCHPPNLGGVLPNVLCKREWQTCAFLSTCHPESLPKIGIDSPSQLFPHFRQSPSFAPFYHSTPSI